MNPLDSWASEGIRDGGNAKTRAATFYAWTAVRRRLIRGEISLDDALVAARELLDHYLGPGWGETPAGRLQLRKYEVLNHRDA
jgi:hypothetical protein